MNKNEAAGSVCGSGCFVLSACAGHRLGTARVETNWPVQADRTECIGMKDTMGFRTPKRPPTHGLVGLCALVVALLACHAGAGSDTRYLRESDLILLQVRRVDESPTRYAAYAVTRSQTIPGLWESTATDVLEQVTAASHGTLANSMFPFDWVTGTGPIVYGTNGLHYTHPIPAIDAPVVQRPSPPNPPDEKLQPVHLRYTHDEQTIAYTLGAVDGSSLPVDAVHVLWLYDAQSGENRQIYESPLAIRSVVWSPDDRYLFANIRHRLHRWDRETDTWDELIDAADFVEASPDGRVLLWYLQTRRQFAVSRADGSRMNAPANEGTHYLNRIAWSPDGRYLAYQSADRGTDSLHIVDLETDATQVLYRFFDINAAGGFPMVWSPTSDRMGFVSPVDCSLNFSRFLERGTTSNCGYDLFVVDVVSTVGASETQPQARRITQTARNNLLIDTRSTLAWLSRE